MLKIKKITSNYIYIIGLGLYLFMYILSSTYMDLAIPFFSLLNKVVLYFSFGIMLIILLINKTVSLKKLFIYILLIILGFFIFLNNKDTRFVMLLVCLIALPKDINLKSLFKTIFAINSFTIIITILFCILGIIPDYTYVQRNMERHALGFVSANSLSNLITITTIIYTYIKKDKFNIVNSICCILILIITYIVTDSRMAFLLGIITVISLACIKKINKSRWLKNIIYKMSKYAFIVLFLVIILCTLYIVNSTHTETFYKLNSYFSGRLTQIINFYNEYGIHLVGKQITTVGIREAIKTNSAWNGIDTSYVNYTLRYGILFMSMFSILYLKLGEYFKKNDMLYEAILVLIICIMGITENILFIPYYNISIFWISKFLLNETSKEEKVNV